MFDIFGLHVYLYGLLVGLGVWAGFSVSYYLAEREIKEAIDKTWLWILIPGLIGARFYHVIDYWERYYVNDPVKVFYLWEGGLGIWGAILGGLLGLKIFSLIKKYNFWDLADYLVIGAPLAQAIGRLGNWANKELYGKNGEPLFAYEACLNLILFFLLISFRRKITKRGSKSGIYLAGYGVIRILLEGLRPEEQIWKTNGVPTAVLFGILAILIGICLYRLPRRSTSSP